MYNFLFYLLHHLFLQESGLRKNTKHDNGSAIKDESALFAEYRKGLRKYIVSPSAGSYRMNVSRLGVTIDFYAGDSEEPSAHFLIR